MKLAREIREALRNEGAMATKSEMDAIIAAKLEPVREAFEYAWSWVEASSEEDERKCATVSDLLSDG